MEVLDITLLHCSDVRERIGSNCYSTFAASGICSRKSSGSKLSVIRSVWTQAKQEVTMQKTGMQVNAHCLVACNIFFVLYIC